MFYAFCAFLRLIVDQPGAIGRLSELAVTWRPASGLETRDTAQRGEAATKVAQVSNLPYRGFPIRMRHDGRTLCRLEAGDTAGWKPALQSLPTLLKNRRDMKQFPEILIECNSALLW